MIETSAKDIYTPGSSTISHYFNLTEVLSTREIYEQFMEVIFALLDE